MLTCLDQQGKQVWAERGLGNGALCAAGERLTLISAEGELSVAEASPEKCEELSRQRVIGSGKVLWTVPVLVNGRIHCRGSRGTQVCRDHRAQWPGPRGGASAATRGGDARTSAPARSPRKRTARGREQPEEENSPPV